MGDPFQDLVPGPRLLAAMAERVLGMHRLDRIYHSLPRGLAAAQFLQVALQTLQVRLEVAARDLEQIPAQGPVIVVANHPFGGIEGIALAHLLLARRKDVRVLANYLLARIPELRELLLVVDPFARPDSPGRSLAGLRRALRWLAGGGLLAVFPAGEVAHLDLVRRRVTDPPWSELVARLARRSSCPVVPVYFSGRNGITFQLAGLLHPLLRTALLPRALLACRGRTLQVQVGSEVKPAKLAALADDRRVIAYLRERTEILAERAPLPVAGEPSGEPVQPRRTPNLSRPIAPPVAPQLLQAEIAQLGAEALLVDSGNQAVYIASAAQIPSLLQEIGRLREVTFRTAGEGTGRELDLDRFDQTYQHLFIWDKRDRQVIGGYRLGSTTSVLDSGDLDSLYTSTLFRYDPRLFRAMGPALEMGRSFIRPEHQRSYSGLLLLWKGIGAYVLRNPGSATLFGPVSISAGYRSASQQLIVTFLQQNRYVHQWSRWVRPRTPFQPGSRHPGLPDPLQLTDLEEVSSFIAEIELDRKGVPILLKQYLKLGGRLLGFNVDPDFANVLDVLLLVDLHRTDPRILTRYMGKDGVQKLLSGGAAVGNDA